MRVEVLLNLVEAIIDQSCRCQPGSSPSDYETPVAQTLPFAAEEAPPRQVLLDRPLSTRTWALRGDRGVDEAAANGRSLEAGGSLPSEHSLYLHPPFSQELVKAATHWVLADLHTEARPSRGV